MRLALVVPVLAALHSTVLAESKPDAPVISLDKAEGINFGTIGKASDSCNTMGPTYAVGGLSIFQPVKVTLVVANPKQAVHLHITKPAGTDIIFDGDTNDKGVVIARFRTQGDMRIVITSEDNACHFSILVWAGGILPPRPKSILRPIP